MIQRECPVVFKTHGPGHHFFGYYDKSPFDRSERRLLSHRASFDFKRLPKADDVVTIGYWSMDTGEYHEVAGPPVRKVASLRALHSPPPERARVATATSPGPARKIGLLEVVFVPRIRRSKLVSLLFTFPDPASMT